MINNIEFQIKQEIEKREEELEIINHNQLIFWIFGVPSGDVMLFSIYEKLKSTEEETFEWKWLISYPQIKDFILKAIRYFKIAHKIISISLFVGGYIITNLALIMILPYKNKLNKNISFLTSYSSNISKNEKFLKNELSSQLSKETQNSSSLQKKLESNITLFFDRNNKASEKEISKITITKIEHNYNEIYKYILEKFDNNRTKLLHGKEIDHIHNFIENNFLEIHCNCS